MNNPNSLRQNHNRPHWCSNFKISTHLKPLSLAQSITANPRLSASLHLITNYHYAPLIMAQKNWKYQLFALFNDVNSLTITQKTPQNESYCIIFASFLPPYIIAMQSNTQNAASWPHYFSTPLRFLSHPLFSLNHYRPIPLHFLNPPEASVRKITFSQG